MAEIKKTSFPYITTSENSYAFTDSGLVEFSVVLSPEVITERFTFIIDIYAADNHSHPHGHAGWWEMNPGSNPEVMVRIAQYESSLETFFDNEKPAKSWLNPDFVARGRKLILHLVLRDWDSEAILFNDPISLSPPPPLALSDDLAKCQFNLAQLENQPPLSIPTRWFILPPKIQVLLVFENLRSAGIKQFCDQLMALLSHNQIPCQLYAQTYSIEQRSLLKPAAYLQQTATSSDLVFFIYTGEAQLLPLITSLPSHKVLYQKHLPDYQRFQAFDAELARSLEEASQSTEFLLKFDGLCYESNYTCEVIGTQLQDISPSTPPTLGIFPPSLWPATWEGLEEEVANVPDSFIFSVGSYRPDKHHEHTLRIFAEIAKCHPTIGLVLAGHTAVNGYWDYLNFLRQNTYAAFTDRIVYLQDCPRPQMLYLYKRAAMFITSCSYEGYSNSLADALHFNLPIVARQTRSIQQMLGFSGLQYDAAVVSPAKIAQEALALLESPETRKQCLTSQKRMARVMTEATPAQTFLNILYQFGSRKE